jgi:hypothetical protein
MKQWLVSLTCLLLAAFVGAQTPASKPAMNCTVQGQIVQQPGALPIRKADIRLLSIGLHMETEKLEYFSATDAEGRFKIENVKPGTYRVLIDRVGFVDAGKRHHGNGMLLSLESAQQVKDLLFPMAPASAITGRIIDIDGDPVPNVDVEALPFPPDRHSTSDIVGARSDDLGDYRLGGLSARRYLVMAQPVMQLARAVAAAKTADKNEAPYTTTYYPGTTQKSQAIPLELRPGDEVPANITLASARSFRVRGEVAKFPGTNDEVSVILRPLDEDFMAAIEPWPVDKDGRFEIREVLPGSYTVLLTFNNAEVLRMMRGDQIVHVANADVDGLRVIPLANGEVLGQFRMDDGKKVDWSQFDVRLYSDQPRSQGSYMSGGDAYSALRWDERLPRSDVMKDGSFQMKDVAPDTYRLQVDGSEAVRDYFVKAVNLNGKDVSYSGFAVGGTSSSLEIVLSADGAAIEGVVTSHNNSPASDIEVICIPDSKRRERHDLYQEVKTDHRGHFSLRGLNPGQYKLFPLDEDIGEDEISDPEFVRAHESLGETINLEEGDHKNIVLTLPLAGD